MGYLGKSMMWVGMVLSICIGGGNLSWGQISQETPLPSERYSLSNELELNQIASLDNQTLRDNEPDRPGVYLFGHIVDVDFGLEQESRWSILPNGDRIWRVKLFSPNAHALRFIFDKYKLPVGAQLFIYNPDRDTLGAFTAYNNSDDGNFATDVLDGSTAIIEYYEPKVQKGEGVLHLSQVSHAYRAPFSEDEFSNPSENNVGVQGFGDAASCQDNAECANSSWDDAKNATVLFLESNSSTDWYCSGVMLNTVSGNNTPYMLTAKHCIVENDLSSALVRYNYQSPLCNTTYNGPTDQSISGVTLISDFWKSDFALLELDRRPPDEYNVYLAGWDRSSSGGGTVTAMFHHPKADVKKFSIDNSAPQLSSYSNCTIPSEPYGSHWEVNWDDGSSNTGSSGAPYFNYLGQVIGQHHGYWCGTGGLTCDDRNYYGGRFAYSWNQGSSSDKRLKDWLDPNNTNPTSITGKENDGPPKKPTNLSLTGSTHPQLSWNHSQPADFDYYKVFRENSQIKFNPGVDCGDTSSVDMIATTTSKNYTDTDVDMSGASECGFMYYVTAVDDNGYESPSSSYVFTTGIYNGPSQKKMDFEELVLSDLSNYPNPFNPSTTIEFTLEKEAIVLLAIYNLSGKQVDQLINSKLSTGTHSVQFNGSNVASGMYLMRLEAKGKSGATVLREQTMHLVK